MDDSPSLSLRQKIAALELVNWKGQVFVPVIPLHNTLEAKVLRRVFQERDIERYQEDESIEATLNGGHRVFATLNAIGQEKSILLFMKRADSFLGKSLDSGLPYEQSFLEAILPECYERFYQYQWKFSSPVFRRNLHDRTLPRRTILPFLDVKPVSSQGAFAEVSRVILPRLHQEIVSNSSCDIVLIQKKLNLSNHVEHKFHHEQHMLSMLRILRHPNIVEFHAAFTLDRRPTLLLGEAECDLREWFQSDRSMCFSDVETLAALCGLSSALYRLHEYFLEDRQVSMVGCHFDLHPGNILVRDRTFVLSDFGLSRLKYESQGSKSYFKGGVRDYCAPECQAWDTFDPNKSGRPSDIWSFGCIVAEVASFLKHGPDGVRQFSDIRRIHGAHTMLQTFHDRGGTHQGVTVWMEELGSAIDEYPIVAGLADCVNQMLAIDPLARLRAHGVLVQLYLVHLNFRYCETLRRFKHLLSTSDYGFRIEYERLKIWAQQIGLGKALPGDQDTTWAQDQASLVHFENVLQLVAQIGDHCETQRQYVPGSRQTKIDNLPLHVFRLSIDALWQTQKPGVVDKMNDALENLILSVEDTQVSQMATFLPKGSRPQLLLAIRQAMRATDHNMQIEKSLQVDRAMISEHQDWQGKLIGRSRMTSHEPGYIMTEFIQYDDSWIGRSIELIARINALVSILSKLNIDSSLPLLRCTNFCHCPDRQAYGMMYEIPKHFNNGDDMPQPQSLAELIKRTTPRAMRPALDEVFNLAYTLARSMLSLHKAGWLHKSVSAYNIIFFPGTAKSPADSLSTVRLIGFNHSRESDEGVITVGPREDKYVRDYQHPIYRKGGGKIRFREEFDYHSLGIVLLELGRWKPLRDMIKDPKRQVLTPQDLKECLLREEVTQLKSYMGSYYHDAVVACFGDPEEAGSSSKVRKPWHHFDQRVVSPLSNYLALCPSSK